MKLYLLVTEKKWHTKLFDELVTSMPNVKWILINTISDFNEENLSKLNPEKVFIPHWSYIISREIYSNYECIVFHMTDLPYGRGGSPLQNLVVRGHESTKVSALRVSEGIDTGDVYAKKELSLLGTAEEVFIRASKVILQLIKEIITDDIKPVPQSGEVKLFKRRKPQEGDISGLKNVEEIFNHIRMLDAEGYPKAFLEFGEFKIEFSRASLKADEKLIADVRIFKK